MKYYINVTHKINKNRLLPYFVGFDEIKNDLNIHDSEECFNIFSSDIKKLIKNIKDEKKLGISEIDKAVKLKLMPKITIVFRKKEDKQNKNIYYKVEILIPILLDSLDNDDKIFETSVDIINTVFRNLYD